MELTLESDFIIQPLGIEVHLHVLNNSRFYSYFKVAIDIIVILIFQSTRMQQYLLTLLICMKHDCLRAIDGTRVRVRVLISETPKINCIANSSTTIVDQLTQANYVLKSINENNLKGLTKFKKNRLKWHGLSSLQKIALKARHLVTLEQYDQTFLEHPFHTINV